MQCPVYGLFKANFICQTILVKVDYIISVFLNYYCITITHLYSQFKYDLQGVFEMPGGRTDNAYHYVAFCKENEKWILFDDTLVER